ncbi:MAG: hypothetical protein HQ494_16550 [Rhodospirillales bacterium]|nr:hypothetical protein [Rhodospirillales bacterium]
MKIKEHLSTIIPVISFLMLAWTPARSETMNIVGTGDGIVILETLGAAFKQAHPQHTVYVPESIGSSGGIKAVGNDKSLIGRVARKIKNKEKSYGLVYHPMSNVSAYGTT